MTGSALWKAFEKYMRSASWHVTSRLSDCRHMGHGLFWKRGDTAVSKSWFNNVIVGDAWEYFWPVFPHVRRVTSAEELTLWLVAEGFA